jgi:SAM-dependent methyltransferase
MKLNIGSGYKKYTGYVNIDADINCNPDIILNLDDTNLNLPFEDNSVTDVRAFHILEHIGAGYFKLLQEIYRVCKPGAIIEIQVPHPTHEIYLNDPTHKRPITVEGMRLFSKKFNQLEIERGGSSSTLGFIFDVDFELVQYDYIYDPYYQDRVKMMSQEVIERLFREALNTTLEIHMKVQVIK